MLAQNEIEKAREELKSSRDVVQNWTKMKEKMEDQMISERNVHVEQVQMLRAQFVRYRTAQHEVTSSLEKQIKDFKSGGSGVVSLQVRGRQTARGNLVSSASKAKASAGIGVKGVARTSKSPSRRTTGSHDSSVQEELLTQLQANEDEINRLTRQLEELQYECSTKAAEAKAAVKVLSGTSALQRSDSGALQRSNVHQSQQMLNEALSEVRLEVAAQEVKKLQLHVAQEREECSKLRVQNTAQVVELNLMRQAKAPPRVQTLLQQIARLKAQISSPESDAAVVATKRQQTDQTLESTKTALQSAREEISRKSKLISSMKQARNKDEQALREAESKQAALEDKLKRASSELTRRRSAIEEMQRRLGNEPVSSVSIGGRLEGVDTNAESNVNDMEQIDSLRERLRAAAMDRARAKQQVNVLKSKIEQQSKKISELENTAGLSKNNEDRISSLKIAIGQKDTALKVAKTKYLGKA